MEADLRDFLETGKKWERIRTKTPGLFIRRMPESSKKPPSLAIELNPPDHRGNPTKKNGIFIRSTADVEIYNNLLNLPQIEKILEVFSKINPPVEGERTLDI